MKSLFLLISIFLISTPAFSEAKSSKENDQKNAVISDSFTSVNKSSTTFFFVAEINGKKIENSYVRSKVATYGEGPKVITIPVSREVEEGSLELKLVANTYHATPVSALIKKHYYFESFVNFSPVKGKKYIVRGELGKENKELWIEEYGGKVVVSSSGISPDESNEKQNVEASKFDKFTYIKIGDSLNDVVALLGEPDSKEKKKPNYFLDKPAMQYYTYKGFGTIRFANMYGDFQVSEIKSLKKLLGDTMSGSNKGINKVSESGAISVLRTNLEKKTGESLKLYAEEILGQRPREHELLDVLAEKIWKERNTKDEFSAATAAILCKTIMKSEDARYRSFLTKVAAHSESAVVRKYATKALKRIPEDAEVAQYEI